MRDQQNLSHAQRVLRDEVLHKNPDAKILPSMEFDGKLPEDNADMVPYYHTGCGLVAFYYTHVPAKNEMLTATRARFPDGTRPERGQKFVCGSCKSDLHFHGELTLEQPTSPA